MRVLEVDCLISDCLLKDNSLSRQAEGEALSQVKCCSTWQLSEQPSPARLLLSSHA